MALTLTAPSEQACCFHHQILAQSPPEAKLGAGVICRTSLLW